MKTSFSPFILFALLGIVTNTFATNYNNYGATINYNLLNGDTLRIVSGTYQGSIVGFHSNAVIIINSNSTFRPSSIKNPYGNIINYGTCVLNYNFSPSNSLRINNYYIFQINGSASIDGGSQVWTNYFGAQFIIAGDFQLQSGTTFINEGTLNVGDDLSLNTGSTFENYNVVSVTDQFQLNGGLVDNKGSIEARITTLNSGTYTNSCRLVADGQFTNNVTLINDGMLWVKERAGASNLITNNSVIINGANAVVKSINFTNNNTIRGSGYWYFTGSTTNNSVVGVSGYTTDTLKIYDVTRTSPTRIFDIQWGTVYPNAVYRTFPAPDTVNPYPGCSEVFKSGMITLPVKWQNFSVKSEQYPKLLWSAAYEPNTRFEVERSYDNSSFKHVSTLYANTSATYSFCDVQVDDQQEVVYYRIKGISSGGMVSYTETKAVRRITNVPATLSVYPNPSKDVAAIRFKLEESKQIVIQVSNISGQLVLTKNVMAARGINQFSLPELAKLMSGVYFIDLMTAGSVIATERFIKN